MSYKQIVSSFHSPILYSKLSLVICFIHNSVYMLILVSQFIAVFPHWCLCIYSLCVCIYFWFADRFICTIFSRFHIHELICDIWFSLSDLLHPVWQTLGQSMSLQMTNFDPFYGWVIFHCIGQEKRHRHREGTCGHSWWGDELGD